MSERRIGRRRFGKLAAAAGAGLAAPGLLAGRARAAGYEVEATGEPFPLIGGLDQAMKDYMSARSIPNGALAVVYQGRLVVARGYTLIDGSNRPLIEPTALFRLGSLSKAITATATIAASEDDLLGAFDPLRDHVDLTPLPGDQADPLLNDITLWHLLHHEGGWTHVSDPREVNADRKLYLEPLLLDREIRDAHSPALSLPISQEDVVRFVSGRQRLAFAPGADFVYCNYGYLLLGMALDAVTPDGYAQWVRDRVFAPLGLDRPLEGQSVRDPQRPGEVEYFSQHTALSAVSDSTVEVPTPYGQINRENWLSSGSWVMSAIDYARFLSVYEDGGGVLSGSGLNFLRGPGHSGTYESDRYYGCGMYFDPQPGGGYDWWHTGSSAGTTTRFFRSHAGYTWVALFNQSDDPSGLPYTGVFPMALNEPADLLTQYGGWPSRDLFEEYFPPEPPEGR
ncbi:serine hydrolase domain-containing protein [Streptomyces sp. DSM 44917]|uniref:Serine hydrolase domain-containing protein n=1 Tax=Streptomyces boetiae TaxID=3075541 RepID=A0ABU2L4X9_9ACTN|nr:serine hydrolase domain-containing protein [Streptomyces sp. DSM 44917]MDT0306373.1 serine hydrolase domain-containing protein [Streptomyces sp. DSM 44917]